jgi:hypothetical protein
MRLADAETHIRILLNRFQNCHFLIFSAFALQSYLIEEMSSLHLFSE